MTGQSIRLNTDGLHQMPIVNRHELDGVCSYSHIKGSLCRHPFISLSRFGSLAILGTKHFVVLTLFGRHFQ